MYSVCPSHRYHWFGGKLVSCTCSEPRYCLVPLTLQSAGEYSVFESSPSHVIWQQDRIGYDRSKWAPITLKICSHVLFAANFMAIRSHHGTVGDSCRPTNCKLGTDSLHQDNKTWRSVLMHTEYRCDFNPIRPHDSSLFTA